MVAIVLCVALLTYVERKVIGYMQARIGPNRVGPFGLLQPFADVIKLMLKEIILPANAARFLFLIAPLISIAAAFATWAVVPFSPEFVFADIDAGLLYILALTSMSVYGIIIAGWATNSKYAFLGAMRSAAQMVAYEIAMGFALVGVLMAAGSLNLGEIIRAQEGGASRAGTGSGCSRCSWCISSPASPRPTARRSMSRKASRKSSRAFTSSTRALPFATLFVLPEYANMILISALTALFFFGGWLSPVDGLPGLPTPGSRQPSFFWLALKIGVLPVRVPLAARDLPALPLRPDHASRLEGAHPGDPGVDRASKGVLAYLDDRALGQ